MILQIKNIYLFCSHEVNGLGRSTKDLKMLYPTAIVHQRLVIYGSKVNYAENKIYEWLKENKNSN